MSKRVRITNDSLNSYGFRVLTAGVDTKQYERNPVLLYMHNRGEVIGFIKDIKVSDEEITGELVFDEASELSARCAKQYEFGSLKMVSAGIDIIEMSAEPEYLAPGQTRPTITKSKLFEVSLVDIGANDDAIVLHKDGELVTLSSDGSCPLPLLSLTKSDSDKMELSELALKLGLPADADQAAILAALDELLSLKGEVETLKAEKELTTLSSAVQVAIDEKRIGAECKEKFIELGKKIGIEELNGVFASMSPVTKLSGLINNDNKSISGSYQKLSDVPADKLMELRKNNPEEYKSLYRAEYGIDCELV